MRTLANPFYIETKGGSYAIAVPNNDRSEALRAFVAGYVASRPSDVALGREAERAFARWYDDPSVVAARNARRGGGR